MSKYKMSDKDVKKFTRKRKLIVAEIKSLSKIFSSYTEKGLREVLISSFMFGFSEGLKLSEKKKERKDGK